MAALVTAFQGITVANGYNNTVINVVKAIRDPKHIALSGFPEIGIEFGDSTFKADDMDSAWTVFNEIVDVHVVGYIQSDVNAASDPENANELSDLSESFCHDLKKKICTDILVTNVADGTTPWNIERGDITVGRAMFFGEQRSIGMVYTSFKVRIRNQSASFT